MVGLAGTLRAIENKGVIGILSSKLHRNLFQFSSMSPRSQDSSQLPWKKIKVGVKKCKPTLAAVSCWGDVLGAGGISSVTGVLAPSSIAAAVRWCSQVDANCSQRYRGKRKYLTGKLLLLL